MRAFFVSLLKRILNDNISFLAGGVAFYGLLALFPALAALVGLFGLVANPAKVQEQLEAAAFFFPPDVYQLLNNQVMLLVAQSQKALSVTVALSVVLALSSATRGTKALIAALQVIFRVTENRPWWKQQMVATGMTFGGLLLLILALIVIVAMPFVLQMLPDYLQQAIRYPVNLLRWILLTAAMWVGLFLLFAFGPRGRDVLHGLQALVVGASVATFCWVATAIAGSWLAQKVPQLHAAYGSLSAVILLMVWMVASAYCILCGAAVTAVLDEARLAKTPEAPLIG